MASQTKNRILKDLSHPAYIFTIIANFLIMWLKDIGARVKFQKLEYRDLLTLDDLFGYLTIMNVVLIILFSTFVYLVIRSIDRQRVKPKFKN